MAEAQNEYLSAVDKLVQSGTPIQVPETKLSGDGRDVFVIYMIHIGAHQVRRRFSDFVSFREILVRQNPTIIIPPIPEKQGLSMVTKADEKSELVERRKRALEVFLNRIARHSILAASKLFLLFLDMNVWAVPAEEKTSIFSTSTLLGAVSAVGNRVASLKRPDARFLDLSNYTNKYAASFSSIDRNLRKLNRRLEDMSGDVGELAALYRVFANAEKELAHVLQKLETTTDELFLTTRFLYAEVDLHVIEPFSEYTLYPDCIFATLRTHEQLMITAEKSMDSLDSKRDYRARLEAPAPESGVRAAFSKGLSMMTKVDPETQRQRDKQALDTEIAELEKKTDTLHAETTKTGEAVVREMERFQRQKALDIRNYFVTYTKAQITFAEKNLAAWESTLATLEQ